MTFNNKTTDKPSISLWEKAFEHVNNASIIVFRIGFGGILLIEALLYLFNGKIDNRIANDYHFTYWPFDFISPLPGYGMELLFALIGLLSIFIMIGCFYRISIFLFFISYTYVFLIDGIYYLNHNYLICLLSFIMIFLPLNYKWSVDAYRHSNIQSSYAPKWTLWLLQFTIALPYFFGGIAKLNHDWLRGFPMKIWLRDGVHFPIPAIENLLGVSNLALLMSYSGLFLDLLIIPALLYKRTRIPAFVVIVMFHLLNHKMFHIDIFPWLMIVSSTLFFSSDWPLKLDKLLGFNLLASSTTSSLNKKKEESGRYKMLIKSSLIIWMVFHLLFPLRHFVIPGNVHWTHEGQRFSWHMMLNHKTTKTAFLAVDKNTGERYPFKGGDYLSEFQKIRMAERPHWIWRFCKLVKNDFKQRGIDVEVYAYVEASLNGRTYQVMTEKTIDISEQPRNYFGKTPWVKPLTTPLEQQLPPKIKK